MPFGALGDTAHFSSVVSSLRLSVVSAALALFHLLLSLVGARRQVSARIPTRVASLSCLRAFSSFSLARGRLIYDFVFQSFVLVPAVLRKEQRKVCVLSTRPHRKSHFLNK